MADALEIDALIRSVRACFHRLADAGNALHAEDGVTSGMRGVMESLSEGGKQTVPRIARAKTVSRQHIQVLADQLIAAGFATIARNPAHKRSHLIELTREGERVFGAIRAREKTLLKEFAGAMDSASLQTTVETLRHFNGLLNKHFEKNRS